MAGNILEGKAWIGFSILCLAVTVIVYCVASADISLKVQSNVGVELKVGEGSTEVNVINVQSKGKGFSGA